MTLQIFLLSRGPENIVLVFKNGYFARKTKIFLRGNFFIYNDIDAIRCYTKIVQTIARREKGISGVGVEGDCGHVMS